MSVRDEVLQMLPCPFANEVQALGEVDVPYAIGQQFSATIRCKLKNEEDAEAWLTFQDSR